MNRFFFVWLLLFLPLMPSFALADTIFESGTLGPTGIFINEIGGGTAPGGAVVSSSVFDGVRFHLSQPADTTRVGGHFVADPRFGNSFFGAIVQLDSETDFPNSNDLSTPDVLGTTLLTFPNPSAEVFGDLSLRLDSGWYAVVFGSGLFGATGSGAAILNNPDIGSPSYLAFVPNLKWVDFSTLPGPFENFRLVVAGSFVPEPNTSRGIPLLLAVASCIRRK